MQATPSLVLIKYLYKCKLHQLNYFVNIKEDTVIGTILDIANKELLIN